VAKDILTRQITINMSNQGRLDKSIFLFKKQALEKIADLDLIDGSILEVNKTNFLIRTSDIKSAVYNHT